MRKPLGILLFCATFREKLRENLNQLLRVQLPHWRVQPDRQMRWRRTPRRIAGSPELFNPIKQMPRGIIPRASGRESDRERRWRRVGKSTQRDPGYVVLNINWDVFGATLCFKHIWRNIIISLSIYIFFSPIQFVLPAKIYVVRKAITQRYFEGVSSVLRCSHAFL